MPLDDHGVPQHSDSICGGTSSVIPARAQSCSKLPCTPGPPSAGPNMVFTQAGRYTAAGSPAGAGRRRRGPPPGSSRDHSGTRSVPATARAPRLAAATAGATARAAGATSR